MKKPGRYFFVLIILFMSVFVRADEGMWLLSLLDGYTIEDMQSKGFQLTAEDIYSVNQACLKDAVIIFGRGCTGELISNDGLLLTNHHCGYGAIQSHSSVENDYLTDGFWAMNRDEELPNEGLTVRFLRRMKDVGEVVFEGTEETMIKKEQDSIIQKNIAAIVAEASEDGKYSAYVQPMFYGNQYFLFVYEYYRDIRLVGAPPSSIGNFGEDTDNWIWPRHTGDFSVFRIYADQNNEPAEYSPDNIPYTPRKFLEISMDGVKKGDFTMILGYPGSTDQFLYSKGLEIITNVSLPLRIDLRTQRMEVMDKYMKQSDVVRIQYAAKYRGVSNAWKKWQGAIRGLNRLDAVNRKIEFETAFDSWMQESQVRKESYGDLLNNFEKIYSELEQYQVINDLMREAVLAVEQFRIATAVRSKILDSVQVKDIRQLLKNLYKDYNETLDQEMFAVMMLNYKQYGEANYYPDFFKDVEKKYKGDFFAYAEKLYSKSSFSSLSSIERLIDQYQKNPSKVIKKMKKEPVLLIYDQFKAIYMTMVIQEIRQIKDELEELYRVWVNAQFEMNPDIRQYPDANFTMRLTYGEVEGYQPEDAVRYTYATCLEGVIEKGKEGKYDYVISEKLADLYKKKDYGNYGVNGTMPVCFAASNHTSGGNSGSPVLNKDGRLIGINFDRNWHGTMSDEMYDPDMCRNISVDIRYVLFIIDKFAGAGYLLDEMVLVKE